MTTPPTPTQAKTREEWASKLDDLTGLVFEGRSWLIEEREILDAIMSLQASETKISAENQELRAEVERLRTLECQTEKEAPIFSALMIELRGGWAQYQHYADLLNEARGFEKARQPK